MTAFHRMKKNFRVLLQFFVEQKDSVNVSLLGTVSIFTVRSVSQAVSDNFSTYQMIMEVKTFQFFAWQVLQQLAASQHSKYDQGRMSPT